ncbi:MAG: NYN domain-containing protein [Candidatus Parcubacteria bacterium]|nr:NYN domain-containing protein [Candidatus Parcubacteria bacterium]
MIKVAIIIDGPNLLGMTTLLGKNINFNKFLKHVLHVKQNRKIVSKLVFHDILPVRGTRNGFYHVLEDFGFEIVDVPLKRYGPQNQKAYKSRTDQAITIEIMCQLKENNFDHLILVSGDSDYEFVLKVCLEAGKTVEIWATSNNIAYELRAMEADIYLFDAEKFSFLKF